MTDSDRAFLTRLFDAAVKAADPRAALVGHLPPRPKGRTVVIGAGKGAAQLAAAFEDLWEGPVEGVVVTRYGYAAPCHAIKVIEAAHPVPDAAGLAATKEVFAALDGLTEDDLVVALITGGGSALLAAPPRGLSLTDEAAMNRALLASGAPISAMNAIRKQVSQVKGGRLALAAHPAQVVTLVVSDVPGDAPAEVASGPTVASMSDRAAAMAAIRAHRLTLPDSILLHLTSAAEDAPTPDDPRLQGNRATVIASASQSLEAAAALAQADGLNAVILSDAIEGEAREVAKMHAAIARQAAEQRRPFVPPVLILSGGETTVTLHGDGGRGGRNSEFLLAFAIAIEGCDGIAAIAADTDGIDGSESNAGAFADGETAAAMRAAGVDPAEALARNDAWGAFAAIDALFSPGPTGTNVNDFRAIWVK
ncbi:glycerate kinase [Pseudooceanicola sp.]|uniref:glycerate kinase type-2 family protein n=1 Tax=Pseudooceanicola sp. TaxID=1914328 RepID=UPI00260E7D7C|nr:glycerate kinase [Pseudooceanicola sp.]MDF1856271.1 glycerate kinase [Pseudooceanicola sp.]